MVEYTAVAKAPCKFPFKYNGTIYNACTNVNYDGYWCATSLATQATVSHGLWPTVTSIEVTTSDIKDITANMEMETWGYCHSRSCPLPKDNIGTLIGGGVTLIFLILIMIIIFIVLHCYYRKKKRRQEERILLQNIITQKNHQNVVNVLYEMSKNDDELSELPKINKSLLKLGKLIGEKFFFFLV